MEKNPNLLKIRFVSDKVSRDIRKLINKYKLPISLVETPNVNLFNALSKKKVYKKHDNCTVCNWLPNNITCNTKFLVYKFTCNFCHDFYVGQSSRPFKLRFMEHSRSLKNNSSVSSALSAHKQTICSSVTSINDFSLDILEHCKNPLDTRLSEARFIKSLMPKMNRKHELSDF